MGYNRAEGTVIREQNVWQPGECSKYVLVFLGSKVAHSDETCLMALGAGVAPKGEIKTAGQIYDAQFAQTIAALPGFRFTATHPVAAAVEGVTGR